MSNTNEQKIDEVLSRGVAEVIDRDDLRKKLLSGEKLRVKLGIDPTSPNLHLGRAVVLLKLRDLQELGHQIIFLVGDFTGIIGDTSDKESERPMLTQEQVRENMQSYFDQAGKLLDMEKVEKHHNSEWLEDLGYMEIGNQADQFSLAEFIARENIKKRLDAGTRISLREVLYPLMQGYDSVALRADIELGGTDQRFNLLAGRNLQASYNQETQNIIMTDLILGTDGRKMSSSWGNTINLTDEPNDMFGKTMSIPDELIGSYFVHCTRVSMEDIKKMKKEMSEEKMNPRDAKILLAKEIVTLYYGEDEAQAAEVSFVETFSKKNIPENIPEYILAEDDVSIVDVLLHAQLATSKSDARRKIEQGGVSRNNEKIMDVSESTEAYTSDDVIKVGKRHFVKLVISNL